MSKMHAILLSLGTDGDVYPFIALGIALVARGHRVTLCANESYRRHAHDHGFSFRPLVTQEESDEVLANPAFWNQSTPWSMARSVSIVSKWGARFFERHYTLLQELTAEGTPVLVTSPGILAARMIHEKLSVPMASVIYTPWMIPSVFLPPMMPAGLSLPPWAPLLLRRFYFRMLDTTGDFVVGRTLNRFRLTLGLRPVRRLFHWWLSPECVIGLFPEWYAPPQPDWPPGIRLAGFPVYDGATEAKQDLLDFCGAGSPPVAFTFGTGMRHAENLFCAAVEACRTIGARGILMTRHAQQLPAALPPFIRHCEFAPFHLIFPRCAAVVHHGGIGTTARALASGIPQLVTPIAFDQPDNAARVKRLGAGDWLSSKRIKGPQLASVLARLMTPQVQARCRVVAEKFKHHNAQETPTDWLEDLAME